MQPVPLEDNAEDILKKALRGLGLSAGELSKTSGVSEEKITAMLGGEFDAAAARLIAPPLGLDPESFVASGEKKWKPGPVDLPGLWQFRNADSGMQPNYYLVCHAASMTAIAFDTGEDASEMIAKIGALRCGLQAICITHTHHDHVGGLRALAQAYPKAQIYIGRKEPLPKAALVDDGQIFELGALTIECRLTTGHSVGGMTYVVHGLARPAAMVGDALFAGSMGGGMISWADALENNRKKLLTLPDETIVCPGHGPLTTIGWERRHNPFYPEFKNEPKD